MILLTIFLYMLAWLVLLAACTWLLLVLHELSHAVAALAFTAGPVTVHIGSYGQPEGNWHLRLGRLHLHLRRALHRWRGGYCQYQPLASVWRNVAIVLAGPVLPLLLGAGGFYLSLQYPNGLGRVVVFVLLVLALLSCLHNLFRVDYIRFADGRLVGTDGVQLRAWLRQPGLMKLAGRAYQLAEAGQYAAGAHAYEQLLRQSAPTPELYQNLTVCYWLAGQLDDALSAGQRFEQALPGEFSDDDQFRQGVLLSRLGRHPEALAVYEALLAQPVPYANAYNNRGYTRSLLGDQPAALADFDQAIAREADVAYAYANRGLAYLRLGREAEALADISHSLALDPAQSYGYRNRGIYYLGRHEYAAALACFEQAGRLDPHTHELAYYLHQARQQLAAAPATSA